MCCSRGQTDVLKGHGHRDGGEVAGLVKESESFQGDAGCNWQCDSENKWERWRHGHRRFPVMPKCSVWVMSCDSYVITLYGDGFFMYCEFYIATDWHEGFFILTVVDLCCTVTTCLYATKFDLEHHFILYDSCVLMVYCDEVFGFLWSMGVTRKFSRERHYFQPKIFCRLLCTKSLKTVIFAFLGLN